MARELTAVCRGPRRGNGRYDRSHRGSVGGAHALRPGTPWPERADVQLEDGLEERDVERWVPSASVLHSNGDAIDFAVRDGRIVGRARPGARPGEPRPARSQGPVRLAGERLARPAHATARPRGRPAGRDRLGHRDGPDRRALEGAARRARRLGPDRLLHQRPAVPRGVLHARRDRQGRHRHAAHGRQHPAVHRHRGGGAEGVVRHRRPARLVHRRRPLRRDRAVRPQRRRDPDRAVDADARPAARRRSAAAARASIRGRPRSRARPTSTWRRGPGRTSR